jgi:hypothetical protein
VCRDAAVNSGSGWPQGVGRPGLDVELKLGSTGAELNDVAWGDSRGANDPLFIKISSVAAVEIGKRELGRVAGILSNLGVLSANEVVSVRVVLDRHGWVTARHEFSKMCEREFLNLIRF